MAWPFFQKLVSLWPLRRLGCLPQPHRNERCSLAATENEARTLERQLRLRLCGLDTIEGVGSSKLQALPPELVHRVLACTTP
eukprot:1725921-Amphidinium_carterae.1